VERDFDAPLLGTADKEIASHPEMVAHGDAFARADLELPLGGHDFSVDTTDVDAGVKAGTIVGFDKVACENFAGTSTAVVRALRAGETTFRPSKRSAIDVEEGVLLLESEPGNFVFSEFHGFGSMVTMICSVGSAVAVVGLGENEDVVTASERVFKDGGGAKIYV